MEKLTEHDIIYNNTLLITALSPAETIGVREPTALKMCVNSIDSYAFGEETYPTLNEKSAILFINLVKKHCFHNGNKRTAYMSLIMFLELNGYTLDLDTDTAVNLCVDVATWNGNFDDLKSKVVNLIAIQKEPLER